MIGSVPARLATGLVLLAALGTAPVGGGTAAGARAQTVPPRAPTPASSDPSGVLAEVVARPLPLRTGIGQAHETVTTKVPRAQQFYDQGLAYLHAYVWIEAARSFNEALRADPALAMGQLGLSYALGELGDAAGARAASQRARALVGGATARERFRVELRVTQLAAADRPGDAAALSAYRTQLARVDAEFGTDVELLLLAGHAASGQAAGGPHQAPGHTGYGMDGGSASLAYYQRARAVSPDSFAIDHYTAHAYENIGRPDAALPFARQFAGKAPAIPHAHHMYGHVLRQVDRMREAIEEFRKADALHTAFAASERIPVALDWHYRHNLDLLATSLQYAGQTAAAAALLRRSFDMPAAGHLGHEQDVNKRAWPLFLLGRGRAQEALDAAQTLQQHPDALVRALGRILTSRALQALGRLEAAAAEGNAGLRQMRALGTAGGTLVPEFELAQGEYLLRAGQAAAGGAMLQSGVAKLMADRSPDAWIATVFQIEAAARIARERELWSLTADLAASLRRHAPFYAGTHYALGRLAEQRGDAGAARAAYAEAVDRWRDADADLPELKDARARLASLGGPPKAPGAPAAPTRRR